MIDWLQPELTSIALCWRLDRRDGVAMGFTSHDRDILVDGLDYLAAPGMLPSAISLSDGFEVDTLDVSGALTSDAINEEDLAAGRWDGASVRLFAVDWEQPEAGTLPLARGELGDIGIRDGAFTAELRGPTALLEQPAVELTSPECRAELGDPECRVDMAGRRLRAVVITSSGNVVTINREVDDRFRFGQIRFLGGACNGERRKILTVAGPELTLRTEPSGELLAGTAVELTEGCDKRLESCATRFSNAENFRGEPHLPGNDLLTRYPGA